MTVTEQSRPKAFDIADYFAPEIIDPKKVHKRVLVFTTDFPASQEEEDKEYALSKQVDHPVYLHWAIPKLSRALPRGIPWHDFPIVTDPFYRIDRPKSSGRFCWDNYPAPSIMELLNHSDVIALNLVGNTRKAAEEAYKVGYFLEKFDRATTGVFACRPDGKTSVEPPAALMQPMQTEMRFRYSYEVNFTAIAMKAFRHLGLVPRSQPDQDREPWKGVRFGGGMWTAGATALTDPLALQWLFRLRRIGTFDVSFAYETLKTVEALEREGGPLELVFHEPDGYIVTLGATRQKSLSENPNAVLMKDSLGYRLLIDENLTDEQSLTAYRDYLANVLKSRWSETLASERVIRELRGNQRGNSSRFFALDGSEDGLWKGTGKHRPFAVDQDVERAASYFVELGLVDFSREREQVSLSDKGNRLLDLFHPDCEDPDVILRWMGEGGLFKPDVQKSCDDWILRFFSKMKTRINEIG